MTLEKQKDPELLPGGYLISLMRVCMQKVEGGFTEKMK